MPNEPVSVEDAFQQAVDTLAEAGPTESSVADNSEVDSTLESSQEGDGVKVPTKLSDLVTESEETPVVSQPVVDDEMVDIPGFGQLSKKEVADSLLRRKDYTQKTQELAKEREKAQEALELWELLQEDPQGTVAELATQLGLGVQNPTRATKQGLESKVSLKPTQDIGELVSRAVQEALNANPILKNVQQDQETKQIMAHFDDIETRYDIKLDVADRTAILQRAVAENDDNIELVTVRMIRQMEKLQKAQENARKVAPVTSSKSSTSDSPMKIASIDDAYWQAVKELSE